MATLTAFVEIAYTRNTVTEPSYSASMSRAAGLMTPELAEYLTIPIEAAPDARPLPKWSRWVQREARVEGTLTEVLDEHTPDEPDFMRRIVRVKEQPITPFDEYLAPVASSAYVALKLVDGQWAVSGFQPVE